MATIKFSELNPIISPSANDIFALSDIQSGESKHITLSNLRTAIVNSTIFSDNANSIITALNGDANTSNGLNASNIFHDGEYRNSDYFLDYTNLTNTPTVSTDLSELTNSTGFLRIANSQISYIPTNGGRVNLTTSNLPEGNNLYYTSERVTDYFDDNFGTYYTRFSATFDSGNISDSYTDTAGQFRNVLGSGEEIQSNTIRVTDTSRLNGYQVGQTLRVYGGSTTLNDIKLTQTNTTMTVSAINFPTTGTTFDFNYRIAEFDYATGEIAPSSAIRTVSIAVPSELPSGTTIYQAFNETYFNRLNFVATSSTRGILVYRNTPIDGIDYKLIAVLGPKEVGKGSWVDYYSVDYNDWTGKDTDNSYTNIIHFPLRAPLVSLRGWTDKTIQSIVNTPGSGFIDITLDSSVYINSDSLCTIAHNDTNLIQTAINSNSNSGLKSIVLNPKRYVASFLSIPDNFGVSGTANITRVTRLPWSANISTTNFVRTSSSSNARNISFIGIDFDGDATNQYLFSDSSASDANFMFDMGTDSIDVTFDKVRLLSPIAGGIYAPNHVNFKMVSSEIKDSGLSDRLDNLYSPLYLTNGTNLVVTGSRFQNFTDNIDASVTNKGVVTNNIIVNCGSGLFIYGSAFMSSEDNVIIGPANEFISTVDTLNSEYDSVNISLQNSYLSSGEFTSPSYKYQENGLDFNLTANTTVERNRGGSANPSFANVFYNTFFVQKNANGVEEIYESNTGIVLNDRAGFDKTLGEFAFSIDANTVSDISNANGQYSYTTLKAANSLHEGIVYTANFEREVESGNLTSLSADPSGGDTAEFVANGKLKYVTVGSEVRLLSTTGTLNIPGTIGIVTALNTSASNDRISIQWSGSTLNGNTATANINIIDRFVMAKGRII